LLLSEWVCTLISIVTEPPHQKHCSLLSKKKSPPSAAALSAIGQLADKNDYIAKN